ncbi:MAG: hypothetical protein IPO21_02915 [Bacteroidales bacterium]|nr:hypothetical protein [Bacteroidales bacterium]
MGFEQIFKNSLTTLPMGGAKGGFDFDPKGKSDNEIMRFASLLCSNFGNILDKYRHPYGDIGVGKKKLVICMEMYKKLASENSGVLTGKALEWGGSRIRPEATGYGVIYFTHEMLATRNETIKDKTICIFRFWKCSLGAVKANELGAKVITLS